MADHTPTVSLGGYSLSKSLLTDLTKLRPPFDDLPVTKDHFGKKLENQWQLLSISAASRTGYDGALFSTLIDGKPHYFIYHQGTNDVKDIPSFMSIANGKPPQQMEEARAYSDEVERLIKLRHPGEQVPLTHVGYSLGAGIAILASKDGQPVVAFDPPGTKKILHAMGRDTAPMAQTVLEVLSPHPNFCNANGEHVGQVLTVGEKFWKTDKVSIGDFVNMSVQCHRIKNLGLALAGMDNFTTTSSAEANYPTQVWDAANLYMHENLNRQSSFGERMLASMVNLGSAIKLDTVLTKLTVATGDAIARRISRAYAEDPIRDDYFQRPVTHPDIEYIVEPGTKPTQEFSTRTITEQVGKEASLDVHPRFTERLEKERQQPQAIQTGRSA
jgi:hypothetical protein